ncbi:MAG: response regulator [Azoarcus sp.]|nr:response regulator [Azoarcus sp.]
MRSTAYEAIMAYAFMDSMNTPNNSTTFLPLKSLGSARRQYSAWIADETMEDYALRYAPRSFRKWSEWRVANTAMGSLSFLALEAIGAIISVNYGFTNAMWAILVVGAIIFLTGIPIAYYAARNNLDMDLLTRGAGFGYLGSTITSLIYAVFTFTFLAIEAAIMAMVIQMVVDWPLPVCYVLSAFVVVPLVMHGITAISRLQAWTQPLWLFLTILPFAWIAFSQPQLYREFASMEALRTGGGFQPLLFAAAAAVVFALIVQIGEQVDYLRFMPPMRSGRRWLWWIALLAAGPGWIVPGILKMAGGAFLAFVAMESGMLPQHAIEPPQMYLAAFQDIFGTPGLAVAVTAILVMVSQIKVNVTNAYAGSLAWSNFFVRATHNHPGRVVWLVFNVFIAVLLMALGVFSAIETVLCLYGLIAAGWIGALAADLAINKPLRLSPPGIEFRRAYLYDFNVGLAAMLLAIIVGCLARSGVFGEYPQAFSSFIVLGLAFLFTPLLALATRGHYYLARPTDKAASTLSRKCTVCGNSFNTREMANCPALNTSICSLCCSLEPHCHDSCKVDSGARTFISRLPAPLRTAAQAGFCLIRTLLLSALAAHLLTMIYVHGWPAPPFSQTMPLFLKLFGALALPATFCAWWLVSRAGNGNRQRMALADAQCQPLTRLREAEAHRDANAPPAGKRNEFIQNVTTTLDFDRADETGILPAALRSTLLHLARRGEAHALRQRLRTAWDEHPQHRAILTLLQQQIRHFDFRALIQRISQETAATTQHPQPAESGGALPFPTPVVLLVDDAIDVLSELCETLSASGYTVLAARDAAEALERLDLVVPDGILLNAALPGITGFELCCRIKSMPAWAHVPVIFMTDAADTGQIVASYLNGGVDYVSKPLRVPEVLARLTTCLRARATRVAREAIDMPDVGVVIMDDLNRVAWRSAQATHWLREASALDDDKPWPFFDEAARYGEAGCALPNGERLLVRHLGACGLGESMFLMSLDAPPLAQRLRQANFTSSEIEIFAWHIKGKGRLDDIASIMGVSAQEADSLMERIFNRLGVNPAVDTAGQTAPPL